MEPNRPLPPYPEEFKWTPSHQPLCVTTVASSLASQSQPPPFLLLPPPTTQTTTTTTTVCTVANAARVVPPECPQHDSNENVSMLHTAIVPLFGVIGIFICAASTAYSLYVSVGLLSTAPLYTSSVLSALLLAIYIVQLIASRAQSRRCLVFGIVAAILLLLNLAGVTIFIFVKSDVPSETDHGLVLAGISIVTIVYTLGYVLGVLTYDAYLISKTAEFGSLDAAYDSNSNPDAIDVCCCIFLGCVEGLAAAANAA